MKKKYVEVKGIYGQLITKNAHGTVLFQPSNGPGGAFVAVCNARGKGPYVTDTKADALKYMVPKKATNRNVKKTIIASLAKEGMSKKFLDKHLVVMGF